MHARLGLARAGIPLALQAFVACLSPSLASRSEVDVTVHGNSLLALNVDRMRMRQGGFPKIKTKSKSRIVPVGPRDKNSVWSGQNHTLLSCGTAAFAIGPARCPAECPFLSLAPKRACFWKCVQPEECGEDEPRESYADVEMNVCRGCMIAGCRRCVPHQDKCQDCALGYELAEGTCKSHGRHLWGVFFAVVAILLTIVLTWYCTLLCGKARNTRVLKQALLHRARASMRDRRPDNEGWYSLFSNLGRIPSGTDTPIGGPGLMLLFNFQMSVLLWTSLVLVGWLIAGWFLGSDLFVIGTRAVRSPQEMCQAVHWGRSIRDQMSRGKLVFTVSLYIASTVAAVVLGVLQRCRFHEVDSKTSTMMDYAALCVGFPREFGPEVEEHMKSYIEAATGCCVVGISVCWDFMPVQREVLELVTNEIRRREGRFLEDQSSRDVQSRRGSRECEVGEHISARASLAAKVCCLWAQLRETLDGLLGLSSREEDWESCEESADRKRAQNLLQEIPSTGISFAVFPTEHERDLAVKTLGAPMAPLYDGQYVIRAQKKFYEPQAIIWSHFAINSEQVARRMLFGVLGTFVAILMWGILFYTPYAYFEANTYAATGDPPGFASEMTFSMLVVIGNQIMYFLCSAIAEGVGFRSTDQAQKAYVLLYTGAVLVNAAVDITIVVFTTYLGLRGHHVRTDDGVLLKDLPSAAAVLESYPMMKVFGRKLFEYNFPSCFLIPFVAEAIFSVFLPYHIGYRLVRTRRVNRRSAENCLSPVPMDLARYGDIMVNLILSTVCFFTASGWVWKTYAGLLLGGLFVYAYDHYKVLRQVESCYMASGDSDAAVQKMLSIPCAVLAAAAMFQLHERSSIFYPGGYLANKNLWGLLAVSFTIHVLMHCWILDWAIRRFKVDHKATETTYSEVAKHWPGNWFTSNPVHCLRSLYVHQHSPPCIYYVRGKEAFLEVDEAHGLHYKPRRPSVVT